MQFSKIVLPGILVFSSLTAAVCSAQTLSIVSGDGQVTPQNFATQTPFTVVAKNAQGQPQPGVTVTWTVASGQGALISGTQTVTDSNGQATNQFVGPTVFGVNFVQSIITASIASSSVNFTV